MSADDHLRSIVARLSEVNVRDGRELWHEAGCPYLAGFDCDCFRQDLVYLVGRVLETRCESRKSENGGKRKWRCDRTIGHDGMHISKSGHRRW